MKKIRVMLSSRCNDRVPLEGEEPTLTALRRELKDMLEGQKLLGKQLLEVWINEEAAPGPGDENAWEHCLRQAQEAEIFVSLYNEHPGWCKGDIGICHAELETALKTGRSKVRLVELPKAKAKGSKQKPQVKRFREFIEHQNLFRGGDVKSRKELKERVQEAVLDALLELARRGRNQSKKDRYDRGEALEWSRLNFAQRKHRIEEVLSDALAQRSGVSVHEGEVFFSTRKTGKVLVRIAAVPGGMQVAPARELLGRPHLGDHTAAVLLTAQKAAGPIHIVGCHRRVTETQAVGLLGFPDALTVKSGFGVYVADNVQKAQIVLLENCRDNASTRHMLQLFFDWLEHSGEAAHLVKRATSRAKIVQAVAKEHER